MAVRLPVVITQSPMRSNQAVDLEEALVAGLLFEPGLDATLVGCLDRIEASSTDHLCLEGLMGDYVLIAWGDEASTVNHLDRLGINGFLLGRTPHFPEPVKMKIGSSTAPKKIYHLDMQRIASSDVVIGYLKKLLSELNTQVVPLRIAKAKQELPLSVLNPPISFTAGPNSSSSNHTPLTALPVPISSLPPGYAREQPLPETTDDSEPWALLDQLVDDLDASDV